MGTLLGYPLDTIKSEMASTAAARGTSDGTTTRVVEIARARGWRSLYAGVSSPLVSLVILNIMNFTTFGFFCRALGLPGDPTHGRILDNKPEVFSDSFFEPRAFAAGALSGSVGSVISTPFELLKVRKRGAQAQRAALRF